MAHTKVYWRASGVPTGGLLLLAAASLAALLAVELFQRRETAEDYSTMVAAARRAERGLEVLKRARQARRRIDPEVDPLESGLIGVASSPVTTLSGHLLSKQTTVNPNWAAVAVKLLREAGVKKGDVVPVAVSGSFPALNLAVYCAVEQIGAEPLVIASGSASQWGANVPGLVWLDMARELRSAGIIETTSIAATLGGGEDRGIGLPDRGLEIIRRAAERADVPLLVPESYEEAVAERIALYAEHAGERKTSLYVNIGGGTASTGPPSIDQYFGSGLRTTAPPRAFSIDSVMGHYLKRDVPVVNFSGITTIARRHGLPAPPRSWPAIGSGGVYETTGYRRGLAVALIGALLGLTYVVTRMSSVLLMFRSGRGDRRRLTPTL